MKKKILGNFLVCPLMACSLVTGCGGASSAPASRREEAEEVELQVFIAASLNTCMQEVDRGI